MIDRTGSLIDHLNIAVPSLSEARAFYDPVLASIGIEAMLEFPKSDTMPAIAGYGWPNVKPFFWLFDEGTVGTNMHLAFTAEDRAGVHAFYDAALAVGAEVLHPPAVHPEYHEHYYGAFVLDPYGINLEAVCHLPESETEAE